MVAATVSSPIPNRVGGICQARKIAALAESLRMPVLPHAGQRHDYHVVMSAVIEPVSEMRKDYVMGLQNYLRMMVAVGALAGGVAAMAQMPEKTADPMPPESAASAAPAPAAPAPPAPAPAAPAPAKNPARQPAPLRDPHAAGMVKATELPDGTIPSPKVDGNFIIGPTHTVAPEMAVDPNVPHGTVYEFTMSSADSKIYPGIVRDANTFGTTDPNDSTRMVVTTSHPGPYTRRVGVYVPKQYVPGTAAPFMVGADGVDRGWFTVLDNLIAQHRVPVMIAISISNGGGDAQGSERGLEYDTMSGVYAEFVEHEVLPLVEKQYNVKLTHDPDGRATMGASSGGSAALAMAWFHPEWYHRVLTRSGTFVNQQWPHSDAAPHGAWEFHDHWIAESPLKPLRIWMQVGDRDNYNSNSLRDNMHDWVVANENMAKVLAAKGYHYQFVFARNGDTRTKTCARSCCRRRLSMCGRVIRLRSDCGRQAGLTCSPRNSQGLKLCEWEWQLWVRRYE